MAVFPSNQHLLQSPRLARSHLARIISRPPPRLLTLEAQLGQSTLRVTRLDGATPTRSSSAEPMRSLGIRNSHLTNCIIAEEQRSNKHRKTIFRSFVTLDAASQDQRHGNYLGDGHPDQGDIQRVLNCIPSVPYYWESTNGLLLIQRTLSRACVLHSNLVQNRTV